MKILVCVKQVPRLDRISFQAGLNRIVREGVDSQVNPLDLIALGHALGLRHRHGGEVVAVTMGPPGARGTLVDALSRGADRAIHLVDMCFAGADTLATARALARLVDRERADIVLLGRSTIDGATAQVAPQLAELAGLAQVTQAIDIGVRGRGLVVTRETDDGHDRWIAPLPAVVSVADGPPAPPVGAEPTGAIMELDAASLGGDPAGYGIRGSATYVQRVMELPDARRGRTTHNLDQLAGEIDALAAEPAPPALPRGPAGVARDLWVMAEPHGTGLHPVTAQAIAAARAVAPRLDARVTAILLDGDDRGLPAELAAAGADRVVAALDPTLATYAPERHTAALASLVAKRMPFAVIGGWTTRDRDFLPRVAARLALGMTGDVVGLDVDAHPGDDSTLDLVWLKPAWAGTALARVVARTVPSFGTLRPGVVVELGRHRADEVEVELAPVDPAVGEHVAIPDPAANRDDAPMPPGGAGLLETHRVFALIGAGADQTILAAIARLAGQRGWGLAGTAEAIAAGLLPRSAELSPRKRSLSPQLVIGMGLAGAADLDAVRGARALVAVDASPPAQICDAVDLMGIVPPADLIAALMTRPLTRR